MGDNGLGGFLGTCIFLVIAVLIISFPQLMYTLINGIDSKIKEFNDSETVWVSWRNKW